jgi:putative hydrolase of the HAD superfamily
MALERSGVPAGEAVMVGDSYQADVAGARAAGMDGILLTRPEGGGSPIPDDPGVPVIDTLAALPPLVAGAAPARR